MAQETTERTRMIVDIPSEVQMAIRIKAVKSNMTTGDVVSEAVERTFGNFIEEAKIALAELRSSKSSTGRKKT